MNFSTYHFNDDNTAGYHAMIKAGIEFGRIQDKYKTRKAYRYITVVKGAASWARGTHFTPSNNTISTMIPSTIGEQE